MEQYRGATIDQDWMQFTVRLPGYPRFTRKFMSAADARKAVDAVLDAPAVTAAPVAEQQPGADLTAEQRQWYANHGVPTTAAQTKRIDQRAASRRCRRCGCSEADGAMFTTMAGGNVCDDCI